MGRRVAVSHARFFAPLTSQHGVLKKAGSMMAIEIKKRRIRSLKPREEECPTCKDLRARIEELEVKIEERKVIEKAKWILVKQKGISEEEAHELLRNTARFGQKKLSDIASNLVIGEKILSGCFPEGWNQR